MIVTSSQPLMSSLKRSLTIGTRYDLSVAVITALLLLSGLLHLVWLLISGSEWEGPLSPRKPGLFGLSAGMTVWSLAWVTSKLYAHRYDRFMTKLIAVCLLIEVTLITIQQWRGVSSHFNHATVFDATIEVAMLSLILIASIWIVWLSLRSIRLPPMMDSLAIAIRGGLWLLTVSCLLGFVITVIGQHNAANGRSAEIWGQSGVLKYPHGAALHAIQLLPMLSWLLHQCRVRHAARLIASALLSQTLFLAHACWQTFQGRSRFDLDWCGGSLLGAAGLFLVLPLLAILQAVVIPHQETRVDA